MHKAIVTVETLGLENPIQVNIDSAQVATVIQDLATDNIQKPRVRIDSEGTLHLQQTTIPAARPKIKYKEESVLGMAQTVATNRTSIKSLFSEDVIPSNEDPNMVTTIFHARIPIHSVTFEIGGGANAPSIIMPETAAATITITRVA